MGVNPCLQSSFQDGLLSLGHSAFRDNKSLLRDHLTRGITAIGNHTFYGNTEMTEIVFSTGLTSIGSYAFYNCGFVELVIPETVTHIEVTTPSTGVQT